MCTVYNMFQMLLDRNYWKHCIIGKLCCMLLIWQFIKYFFAARYLWITFSPLWIVCIHHLLNLSLNFLASIRDTNKKQTRTFKSPSCKIYKMHRVEKSCRNLSWWTLKNILIHSANPLNQNAKSSSISTRNKNFTRITYELEKFLRRL